MDEQAIYERYKERMREIGVPAASFESYMKSTSYIPTVGGYFTERQHKRYSHARIVDHPQAPESAGRHLNEWALAALMCLLLFFVPSAWAAVSNGPVTVNAQLTDGSGNTMPAAFLHFELENCGNNFPTLLTSGISQNPWTIVRTAFDLAPNQPDGSILGQVLGNDQILCGNVASTYYLVTAFKDATTPLAPVSGQPYVICTPAAPSTMPCSNPSGNEGPGGPPGWDPALQQPSFQPVPPGLVQMYGNSPLTQVWQQPPGTELSAFGTFNYTTGIEVGPVTFSQLAGLGGQVAAGVVVTVGSGCVAGSLVISAPNQPGGTQAAGTYSCTSAGGLASVLVTVPGSGYTAAPTASIAVGTGTLRLNWLGFSNFVYVQDGSATNPCTGGGTGAFAFWINGAWECAIGGGGSTSPGSPSGSLQYNFSGSFAGTSVLATNGVDTITGATNSLVLNSSGITLSALGAATGNGGLTLGNSSNGAQLFAAGTGNSLLLGGSTYDFNLSNLHLQAGMVNPLGGNANYVYGSPLQLGVNPGSGTVNNVSNGLTISSSASTLVGPWNVPSGVTLTVQSGASLVCAAGSTCPSSGSAGGNPQLENGTPDETGNSFYTVASLTNYFLAHWEFIFNTTTYVNYTVFCPSARTGDTIAVDVWSADSTAGHTASITYGDGVINSGTMNTGSLTSAAPQTFTTTSTANNRVTLTFTVQSTISAGSILVVKIGTTPTGTAPTANIQIYPHFI